MDKELAMHLLEGNLKKLKKLNTSELMADGRVRDLKLIATKLGKNFFHSIDDYLMYNYVDEMSVKEETIFELIFYVFNTGYNLDSILDYKAINAMRKVLQQMQDRLGFEYFFRGREATKEMVEKAGLKKERLASNILMYERRTGTLCFTGTTDNEQYERCLSSLLGV